ncbi:hypothetical protein J1N35_034994, partial [Gossypium stocksii]
MAFQTVSVSESWEMGSFSHGGCDSYWVVAEATVVTFSVRSAADLDILLNNATISSIARLMVFQCHHSALWYLLLVLWSLPYGLFVRPYSSISPIASACKQSHLSYLNRPLLFEHLFAAGLVFGFAPSNSVGPTVNNV